MGNLKTILDIIKIRLHVLWAQVLSIPLCLKTPQYARILGHFLLLDCFYYSHSRLRKEQELSELNELELSYGETCLNTLDAILKRVPITENDIFMDLGCGKGKLCFYVHTRYKIPVIGVDAIPSFIEHATKISEKQHLQEHCQFHTCNFLQLQAYPATILWVTCTCLSQNTLRTLWQQFQTLEKNSIIISISYPVPGQKFNEIDRFEGLFSWGHDTIYIQQKIC